MKLSMTLLGLFISLQPLTAFADTAECGVVLATKKAIARKGHDFESPPSFKVTSEKAPKSKCDACREKILSLIKSKAFNGKMVVESSNGWDGPLGTVLRKFPMTSQISSTYRLGVSFKLPGKVHPYYCAHGLNNEIYNIPLDF